MTLDLVEALTEPCSSFNYEEGYKNGDKYNKCWNCKGTGRVLNQAGEAFMKFIRDYGDFAEKDHSHYIS